MLGGFFAVNGGGLGDDVGQLYYLSPDNLEWSAMHYSYSDFLNFCFNGDVAKFYEGFRWTGWQKDLDTLSGERGYSFYPPLWTKEGIDIRKDSRKDVPMEELYGIIFEYRRQVGINSKEHKK